MKIQEVVTDALLLLGALLSLLAAVGVLRLPDVFLRMQASAKASTLGLGCLLFGAALQVPDVGSIMRLASIGAFVMLTAPITAHVVARASFLRRTPLWSGTVVNEHDDGVASSSDRGSSSGASRPPEHR